MNTLRILALALAATVAAAPALAQQQLRVYQWKDANGVTHFDQAGGAGRRAVVVAPNNVSPLDPGSLTGHRTGGKHTD